MQKTAFFIISLVILGASATKIDFASFSEIATSDFSKQVVSMMEMNMNSGGSLNQITTLMQKIKSQLEKAQKTSDANNVEDTKQCAQSKGVLNNKIKTFSTQISTQSGLKSTAQSDLRKQIVINQRAAASFKSDTASLATLNANDVAAKSAYSQKMANLTQAIQACEKALSLLGTLSSKTVFAQIHTEMDEIRESLAAFGQFNSEFSPILQILAQLKLSNKIDQAVLSQLVDLIGRLQKALEEEQASSKTAEQARIVRVAAERKRLEGAIRASARAERVSALAISNLKKKIAALSRQISKAQKLLKLAQSQLVVETKRCESLASAYKKDSAERGSEIKIIDALIAHFNKTLAKTSKDIRKLTGAQV